MSRRYRAGARRRKPKRPGRVGSVAETPARMQSSITRQIRINCGSVSQKPDILSATYLVVYIVICVAKKILRIGCERLLAFTGG